jgi:hypothetical protein
MAYLSPTVFIFSGHRKTAKGTAIPINNPLTETETTNSRGKSRKLVMPNNDEIASDEQGTGYGQHDLGSLWAEYREEQSDGYSSRQTFGKMEGIDG